MTQLREALHKHIRNESLVPKDTLVGVLAANGVQKPGKLSRGDLEGYTRELLDTIDYAHHLPQSRALTLKFVQDVLDPVITVSVPTGRYRVTMRKLLRLSLAQLQQQALLMKLDAIDLSEEGIATLILVEMNEDTEITPPLAHILLAKEIASIYGIRFEIPLRGPAHPSSTIFVTVRPSDMVRNLDLSKADLLDECENQGITVNQKKSKQQLAVRLIAWWNEYPQQLREPFTKGFARFLLERARQHGR